jgi:VWFA-related protein
LAFLISFDVEVNLLQDLTGPDGGLKTALRQTQINAPLGGSLVRGMPGGAIPHSNPRSALLYDAVYLASQEKMRHETGRKALIILTDGFDWGSQKTLTQAIEAAQKSDTTIYVLLLFNPVFGYDKSDMKRLCEETGGRMIVVDKKSHKPKETLQSLSDELHSQYYIGYIPTDNRADGVLRKVEVRTKSSDYHVQVRKGYYAPKE